MTTPQHPRGGYAHKGCQCSGCVPRAGSLPDKPSQMDRPKSCLPPVDNGKPPPILRATMPLPSTVKVPQDLTIMIPYPSEIPYPQRGLAQASHLSVLLYGKTENGDAITITCDNAVTVTGLWADGFKHDLPKMTSLPKKLSAKVVTQRVITLPDDFLFTQNAAVDVTVNLSAYIKKRYQGPFHLEAALFAPGVWEWSGYVYPMAPVRG